jgi:hypothetical protein
MQWRNVHVFISSTFNDMHAERDFLIKKVFPRLSEWCEERRLRLIDIDLRWGVSEADATRNRRVVQVCLDRIDECRPFFLCFLGQRRGWVPSTEDVNDETLARFPKLIDDWALFGEQVTLTSWMPTWQMSNNGDRLRLSRPAARERPRCLPRPG